MIEALPVLESPAKRMLTYTLTDAEGAKIILSIRSELADDDLIYSAMEMLAIPRRPAS